MSDVELGAITPEDARALRDALSDAVLALGPSGMGDAFSSMNALRTFHAHLALCIARGERSARLDVIRNGA